MGQHQSVAPGARFAGRYRVEELLAETGEARSWRAHDEILARSVVIQVMPAGSEHADALVDGARRSATVTDPRFLRVLDAAEDDGHAYVVREWATGQSLTSLLASGPLSHRRAGWLAREVAGAVAAAHAAGRHHGRLRPGAVLFTDTGAVRVAGLGTEAAIYGRTGGDVRARDVEDLGRLLYAALVARWPGSDADGLAAAPTEHGRLLLPRQVRAGVPRPFDEICDRVLGRPPRHGQPIRSAADLEAALNPLVGAGAEPAPTDPDQPTELATAVDRGPEATSVLPVVAEPPTAPGPPAAPPTAPPAGPRPRRRGTWAIAGVVLVAVVVGILAVQWWRSGDEAGPGRASAPNGSGPGPAPAEPGPILPIRSVEVFDPAGDGTENDQLAPRATDGDPATEWLTVDYYELLSLQKPGVGLRVDLGREVAVGRVRVLLGDGGTDLELRAAPGSGSPPASAAEYQLLDRATGAAGPTTLAPDAPVRTRYLLIWLTELPAEGPNYKGRIAEIVVRQ